MSDDGFINPYTFIPLGEVKRQQPLGHAPDAEQAKQRYSGYFTVEWDIRTPLACPTEKDGDPAEWGTQNSGMRVPGSSVKGAIRSVHEALFGGCLRQVDPEFRPIYRQLPDPNLMDGYRLGRVKDKGEKEGFVIEVFPRKNQVELVDAKELGEVKDGQEVRLNPTGKAKGNRVVLQPDAQGSKYVVHVTSVGARDSKKPCYWAVASVEDSWLVKVTPEALLEFRWRAAAARDDKAEQVKFKNATVGQRKPRGADLEEGEIVWVKLNEDGQVCDIKRSQLWRRRANSTSLGERLTQHSALPCTGEQELLCLSCQVFGSADTEGLQGKSDARATQYSYAGHVRFGPAILPLGTKVREAQLAPLGQPHPGAGMFYLTKQAHFDTPQDSAQRRSRWDAPGDRRTLRGRKFYWFSDPEDQRKEVSHRSGKSNVPLRYERRGHHSDEVITQALLVDCGTLTQRVTFDGLDRVALLSLLAAFEPARLLGEGKFAHHLGRGKPLGLGAVVAKVTDFSATTVADRYSEQPTELDLAHFSLAEQDRKDIDERCGAQEVSRKAAAKVLRLDGLGAEAWRVSYPTTSPWSKFGSEDFDKSFEYFKKFGGPAKSEKKKVKWQDGLYKELPEATEDDQIMRGN